MRRLQFRIDLCDVGRRLIHCELRIDPALAAGLRAESEAGRAGEPQVELFLPVWTPGSYLVREFAKHIRNLRHVEDDGAESGAIRVAKNRWLARVGSSGACHLRWSVYARDLTVRTAYATAEVAFWNGATTYLWPAGGSELPATIEVVHPPGWQLFAGSVAIETPTDLCSTFELADLDEAVDTPCLAGPLAATEIDGLGRPHRFVPWGLASIVPPKSFAPDLRAVLHATAAVFGGALPFERYTFLALFADAGRGGLEHRDSSALLAPRTTFATRSAYEDFLALIAHEYLHVWNVKRMRPRDLWRYDYETENHTRLLWVAEGFTAYLDDLVCLRAGVSTARRYLGRVASHIDGMHANPGRFLTSLADASFDAWIQLYRPDESTRNVTQNYYTNGALAALMIDVAIRRASGGTRTIDDALRKLWSASWEQGRGYEHADVVAAIDAAAGVPLGGLVDGLVTGPFDPDLDGALELFGLRCEFEDGKLPRSGLRMDQAGVRVTAVFDGGPAERAGLCPGDEIIALERLRLGEGGFERLWRAVAVGAGPVAVVFARLGVMRETVLVPEAETRAKANIVSLDEPSASQLAHRRSWLGCETLSAE